MGQIRLFSLTDVEDVIKLRCPTEDSEVLDLLQHMTGQCIWAVQVPTALSLCREHLLEQVPDLSDFQPDDKIAVKHVPGISLGPSL